MTTIHRPGSGTPFWGMLWEALLGLVFSVPATGSAYGSGLGGLFGAIDRAGIDEDVRARIRRALGPPTSALTMLAREPDPALVADLLCDGGTLVEASLDSELAEELRGSPHEWSRSDLRRMASQTTRERNTDNVRR